jgi:5-methyltetrahydrofolate--homocysteine methyltransferase
MIIIGEKINGAIPAVAKAIASRDAGFIQDLAFRQGEAGADYIDACAGVNPDQEADALGWLIEQIQAATDVPISIDSANPETIARAMGLAQRPGLINSVSLECGKTETLFPLLAGTEWRCVALLCDDDGIPTTVEKRLEIASSLVEAADGIGIARDALFIDPLVIALSTDNASMTKFMDCTRQAKQAHPGIHITSGLSNISFGLPARKAVNTAFLALAMSAGMDSAIMDPLDRDVMGVLYASDALNENDRHIRKYTTAYRKGRFGKK